MHRIFILSPAQTSGERAKLLYNSGAQFPLARQLQSGTGAPLGEVFSFLSGLYFRGKLTYARAFANPPKKAPGILVITSNRGLVAPDQIVTMPEVRAFAAVPIDPQEPRYVEPLRRDAASLARTARAQCEVIFLGSISTPKYVEVLLPFFGERLRFPHEFLGRGDMSRGGLLLRHVLQQRELEYGALLGAVRRGKRPPKLPPLRANRFAPAPS